MTHTLIGLDKGRSKQVSDGLNKLLADLQVFYVNARGFHWNIKGEHFFELHTKFEELYNELNTQVDEVAERILTLGCTPMHAYTEYLKVSTISEVKNVHTAKECVTEVVNGISELLKVEREILTIAETTQDEGTISLMSDYIKAQEKQIWMYSSYLKS